MTSGRYVLLAMMVGLLFPLAGHAQPPLPGGNSRNLQRLPDDQVEGTIWEYRGVLKRNNADDSEVPKLEGRIRIEGTAIFDASSRIRLPSPKEAKKVVDSIRRGEAPEIRAPSAPQQKRIGQYRKLSRSRRRLDFDDPKSLNGIMIIWQKKNTSDVWMGTYDEKEGKKTVREWQVELRPIED